MRITSIEFRRVKALSKVESEILGATAEVGPEGPEQALDDLRAWVDAQFGDEQEARALRFTIRELERQKETLLRQVEMVEQRWTAIQDFMEKLGINRPSDIPETLERLPDGR